MLSRRISSYTATALKALGISRSLLVLLASLGALGIVGPAEAQSPALDDSTKDFKFPIVLCRFKQAVLRDVGGKLKVVVDTSYGPEQAYAVGNVRSLNTRSDRGQMLRVVEGDFAGTYDIPDSKYRVKFEGSIRQGVDSGAEHQMTFATFLQKKADKPDLNGNSWVDVGQSHNRIPAQTQSDGTVWENVYPYTFNSLEMSSYIKGGRIDAEKLVIGIRDGVLEKGAVFKVGPACGFLDGRTAKNVASVEDRERFKAIFDRIPDHIEAKPLIAQSTPVETKKNEIIARNEATDVRHDSVTDQSSDLSNERSNDVSNEASNGAQAEPQRQEQLAENPPQNPSSGAVPGQQMSPQLQAELAQQNAMADQAAANYDLMQRMSQTGGAPANVDAREIASIRQNQLAQSLQAPQSPEQIQEKINALEQQKAALAQQQGSLEQQQAMLAQMQQDVASAQATNAQAQAQTQAGNGETLQPGVRF